MQTVGERIRAERERRGWSQEDLAHAAGVRSNQISRMERGVTSELRQKTLEGIARAFGVTYNWVLRGEDVTPAPAAEPAAAAPAPAPLPAPPSQGSEQLAKAITKLADLYRQTGGSGPQWADVERQLEHLTMRQERRRGRAKRQRRQERRRTGDV